MTAPSLTAGALGVLESPDPLDKVRRTRELAAAWRAGALAPGMPVQPVGHPARPARPELRLPRDMPKRRRGIGPAGRVALLHALAHIELNALDLVWDLVARFEPPGPGFHADWIRVAEEEAGHFELLTGRLAAQGAAYGDLPAHDGLWQAAEATSGDLAARLAVVPMVLEARGLDVTPQMIANLSAAGDEASADVLRVIYRDEIGHVETGRRWFDFVCRANNLEPAATWQSLVRRYYRGGLKRPFNEAARQAAGMLPALYEPLAASPQTAV